MPILQSRTTAIDIIIEAMLLFPDLPLPDPIHQLPDLGFVTPCELALHLLELVGQVFFQESTLGRKMVITDAGGFSAVLFYCSDVASNAALGELYPGCDVVVDDGDRTVFLPHSGFEWRFKVTGRGVEANVAKRTAAGGCLLGLVGKLVRGTNRQAGCID
jgi:hypothetical protein